MLVERRRQQPVRWWEPRRRGHGVRLVQARKHAFERVAGDRRRRQIVELRAADPLETSSAPPARRAQRQMRCDQKRHERRRRAANRSFVRPQSVDALHFACHTRIADEWIILAALGNGLEDMRNLAKALILAAVLAGSPIGQAALSQGSKATSAPAAGEPKALGTFGQWIAAELTQGGSKICYMVARPAKSEGKYSKRGDVLLVVTHRPASKSFDVVTFQAGYAFASGAKVPVNVDGKKFELLARPEFEKESAWSPDAKTDKALIAALRSGKTAIIQGTSARSTETSDTFGLIGFTRAYATISQACGVK